MTIRIGQCRETERWLGSWQAAVYSNKSWCYSGVLRTATTAVCCSAEKMAEFTTNLEQASFKSNGIAGPRQRWRASDGTTCLASWLCTGNRMHSDHFAARDFMNPGHTQLAEMAMSSVFWRKRNIYSLRRLPFLDSAVGQGYGHSFLHWHSFLHCPNSFVTSVSRCSLALTESKLKLKYCNFNMHSWFRLAVEEQLCRSGTCEPVQHSQHVPTILKWHPPTVIV